MTRADRVFFGMTLGLIMVDFALCIQQLGKIVYLLQLILEKM